MSCKKRHDSKPFYFLHGDEPYTVEAAREGQVKVGAVAVARIRRPRQHQSRGRSWARPEIQPHANANCAERGISRHMQTIQLFVLYPYFFSLFFLGHMARKKISNTWIMLAIQDHRIAQKIPLL